MPPDGFYRLFTLVRRVGPGHAGASRPRILVPVVKSGASSFASARPGRFGLLAVLLATLTMVGPFSIDAIFPAFSDMQAQFGVDAAAMQQAVSVYLLAFAAMSLFHGPISDAVGRKPVILAGSFAYTLASALCALAPTMAWLLGGRALQGMCAGAGMIVGRTVVRDVFEGDSAQRLMAQISMIFSLAPALAPIIGGWILGWSQWRAIFWFLTGFGLLLLVAAWVFLPETYPPARRTPFRPGALASAVWSLAQDPDVARLCAVSALNFAALFTYIAGAPLLVVVHLGLGEADFGVLFVPIVTALVVGSFLTGRLAGRLPGHRFLTLGFLTAALGGAVQLLVVVGLGPRALPWVLLGPLLTALGVSLVFPLVTLVLLEQHPAHRGTASSLQSLTNTLLNALLAGLLIPLVGFSMTGIGLTALGFTLAGWTVWTWHQRRSGPPPPLPGPVGGPSPAEAL